MEKLRTDRNSDGPTLSGVSDARNGKKMVGGEGFHSTEEEARDSSYSLTIGMEGAS